MKKRKTIIAVLAVLLAAALFFGIASAVGEGTETDPLVTLSYINDVFEKHVLGLFTDDLDSRTQALQTELDERVTALEEKYGGTAELAERSTYKVVTLSDGQTMTCSRGTELMLRVGSAAVTAGNSPGLVDTSTAGSLENGEALVKNHMYMVTIEGHGIRAQGVVKIVARGEYEIN